MMGSIRVQTQSKTEVVNITDELSQIASRCAEGLALFYVPHTTASLLICEDDRELREDLIRVVENLLVDFRPFSHIKRDNPNAEAHIFSALGGTSVSLPIADGKLDLGTYQNILLLEMDGPKERTVRAKLIAI